MYSRQESSQLRHEFWTTFGRYMSPIPGAEGLPINWINYKTGFRPITFRMDADKSTASVCITITTPDPTTTEDILACLRPLKPLLEEHTSSDWQWPHDNSTSQLSICRHLQNVNIFNKEDWPTIIAFFKPTIIGLDTFWTEIKDVFL